VIDELGGRDGVHATFGAVGTVSGFIEYPASGSKIGPISVSNRYDDGEPED
jgi:hypothetical protein